MDNLLAHLVSRILAPRLKCLEGVSRHKLFRIFPGSEDPQANKTDQNQISEWDADVTMSTEGFWS